MPGTSVAGSANTLYGDTSKRSITGNRSVVSTVEFADLAAWQAWYDSETVQELVASMASMLLNLETELWGPSPVLPQPIRPGG